jgi:hypothetical protein
VAKAGRLDQVEVLSATAGSWMVLLREPSLDLPGHVRTEIRLRRTHHGLWELATAESCPRSDPDCFDNAVAESFLATLK